VPQWSFCYSSSLLIDGRCLSSPFNNFQIPTTAKSLLFLYKYLCYFLWLPPTGFSSFLILFKNIPTERAGPAAAPRGSGGRSVPLRGATGAAGTPARGTGPAKAARSSPNALLALGCAGSYCGPLQLLACPPDQLRSPRCGVLHDNRVLAA